MGRWYSIFFLMSTNDKNKTRALVCHPIRSDFPVCVCVCVALSCKMIQQNVICNHIRFTLILDCCLQFDSSTFHTVNPGKKKMERQGGGEKKLMKDAKTERWEEQRNKLRSRFFLKRLSHLLQQLVTVVFSKHQTGGNSASIEDELIQIGCSS